MNDQYYGVLALLEELDVFDTDEEAAESLEEYE